MRFCPACDYDLRSHAPGAACPECGEPSPPAGEIELRGWPVWSFWDGFAFAVWFVVRPRIGWLLTLLGLGLVLVAYWLLTLITPRIYQVKVTSKGFAMRFVGERHWQTEPWLRSDCVSLTRSYGVNTLTVVGNDPLLHAGWFGTGEILFSMSVRTDAARLADVRDVIDSHIVATPLQEDLTALPRHPDDPDVIVLPAPGKRAIGINRVLRSIATPLIGAGIVLTMSVFTTMALVDDVIQLLLMLAAMWIVLELISGFRRGLGRGREFRIGPEGYQYAKVDAPLSLTPWHSGDGLDVRTTNFMSRPGVLRMRVVNSRHYPLASFSYVRLTRPQALSLIMAVRTWRPQAPPATQPASEPIPTP